MDLAKPAVSESAIYEPAKRRRAGVSIRALKPGLRFNLFFLVAGLALISISISTFILLKLQRRELIRSAEISTTVLSSSLEANLQHAMLTNDWEMVNDSIQAVVKDGAVEMIRILDFEGVVGASSIPDETGKKFHRADSECGFCHQSSTPLQNKTVLVPSNRGQQSLLNVNLIQNQPECFGCHSPDSQNLGLMIVETPLGDLNRHLSTGVWRTASVALATIVLLCALIMPVLNRFIVRPVEELSKGVMEISAGNLDYPVEVVNRDELGKLAESFEGMRQQLKGSYEEAARREAEAVTLYELGTKISASLALHEVLYAVAEAARGLLGADIGLVGLLDEIREEVVIGAAAGCRTVVLKGVRISIRKGTPGALLFEGEPVRVEAYDPEKPLFHDRDSILEEGITSFLAVPLCRAERFLGYIEVLTRQRRRFRDHEVKLLLRLAHQVAVSIENAQLYRQLRLLATLEERDRLAREMHDNLAQALGYLNVKASMTEDLLSGGRIEQAQESLQELKKVAKFTYTDVREAIFNLRTAGQIRIGLLPSLQDYLADYRVHYGLDTRLVIENEEPDEFLPEVVGQVLRIVQEALTNVRKHACASRAWVHFGQEDDQICIRIEDDGRGFYPTQGNDAGRHSFGLQIMRERAESVGGSLEVDSQPGRGTLVIVRVPRSVFE